MLLAFLVISCLINAFLDRIFVRLKTIDATEAAAIRLISMAYMGALFIYIKFLYHDNNYDAIIIYFIGMLIGRFVYFDASFRDFFQAVKNAAHNFPLLILALFLTALISYLGFGSGYLLRKKGVVVSLLIAHLFLDVCIFLIHYTGLEKLIVGRKKKTSSRGFTEEE